MLKRDSWLWFGIEMLLIFVGLFVFLFAMFRLPENMAKIVICFFGIIAILFCDNSCITRKIREKIPRSSILYRKKRRNLDEMTERYKTAAYLCLLIRFMTSFMGWLTMGLGIVFPVLAVIRYFNNCERIKFSSEDKNYLSTTASILLLPGAILLLWGIDNHKYPIHFWILWIVISLIFIIPFFIYTKEYKKKYTVALGFCASIFLFVFGTVCTINMQYDFSEPMEYRAIVSDKYETSGKSTSYYIVVEHGENALEDTFSVSVHEYREAEIGEHATVVKKDGFLKFEWYYLEIE